MRSYWKPFTRTSYHGNELKYREIVRAALENIAYRVKDVIELM
ncbi:hypothetical protein [Bacillus sp. EB106-08-02-XG196]|nr:hypothetical protein [Bacillus sp. EB106-08-02-XG196]